MDKARLEFFTDALIAIIMTILVLDLKVPAVENASEGELMQSLYRQLPHFYGFLISFILTAVVWFNHHDLLRSIAEPTRRFAKLNFFFVGAIALIPFSTAFAAEHPDKPIAVATLALNLFLMNFTVSLLFLYAIKNDITTLHHDAPRRAKIRRVMAFTSMLMFLASGFIAFLSTTAAIFLMTSVLLVRAIPVSDSR